MRPLRILQVATTDAQGGAALIARSLARCYRATGSSVWQAVGRKASDDHNVFPIGWPLPRMLRLATHPRALRDYWIGREDFEFPGTYALVDGLPEPPDVVHCHNLHGGYFDLRALAWLSHHVPTVVTLHDAWMLSGHCAHSFGCDRWKSGCGQCPDLSIDPPIRRDATAHNWRRKQDIYARSRLYVAAPGRWLLEKVEQSMLAPAVVESRVIPNGVDLSVFHPSDMCAARAALGMPPDAEVLLTIPGPRGNAWRNQTLLSAAIETIAAARSRQDLRVIVLGDGVAALQGVTANVVEIGYQTDPAAVARCFQAADVYLHAARADTFPTVILEALACGTPVVATAVDGIPEQITPAPLDAVRAGKLDRLSRPTGLLTPADDAGAFAASVVALLEQRDARTVLARNAARDARERFDVEHQAETYLAWYGTIISDWTLHATRTCGDASARGSGEVRMAVDGGRAAARYQRI